MDNNIQDYINRLFVGDAATVLSELPNDSIDLIITSPPYWTAVEYETTTSASTGSYENYINELLKVWIECFRILRPNGKLAINTPILPIPKRIIGTQHTRHIKNINNDIECAVLSRSGFLRYSLFIWQKQTSKMMFGSYPYPGNILENNTIEFINVYVKPGKPQKYPKDVKEANCLEQAEWVDLAQQVWFMYPEDVKRGSDHPAPFPEKLPGRLIRMYTFGACDKFEGAIVLDPFCGTGTACAVAKRMRRRFIGIDISEKYVEMAQSRVTLAQPGDVPLLFVGRAEKKHKRETYGRPAMAKEISSFEFEYDDLQLHFDLEES